MIKYLVGVGLVVGMLAGLVVFVQGLKSDAYDAGYNKATIEGGVQLQRLKNVIGEMNKEASRQKQLQLDAYRIALDVRNRQYADIDAELKARLQELKEIEDEKAKDWFNTPVPSVYR